jgi:hypothetical protein
LRVEENHEGRRVVAATTRHHMVDARHRTLQGRNQGKVRTGKDASPDFIHARGSEGEILPMGNLAHSTEKDWP